MSYTCGTGGWSGPLPGDPSNDSILTATPVFGGIDVSWSPAIVNPHAVAHTYLYRSNSSDFATAIRIATVGGTHFFDKLEDLFTYYYWIQVVSINGTVGSVIGPASAVPRPSIDETIIALTGRIDNGMLAQALKADIDRIDLLDIDLSTEINERLLANEALGAALEQVRGEAGQAVTLIQNEITQRTDAQGALLTSIDTLAVGFNENAAAIITERETRVTQTEALANDVSTLYTEVGNNSSAIINEASARTSADNSLTETFTGLLAQSENTVLGELSSAITLEQSARTSGFDAVATQLNSIQATIADIEGGADYSAALQVEQSARVAADEALGQQITTVQATASSKGKAIFSATAPAVADRQSNNVWYDTSGGNNTPKMWNGTAWVGVSDKVATDALSKANMNAAAIQTETTARINADAALASQITTVQSTLGNDIASAQTSLQTNINTVNGKVTDIGALYTAKVGVNGLIGGFGVYNDGTEVQAGFDVDTFWVGRTGPDKKKPFIIDSGTGETYIDKAVIPTLTADMIDTRGLSIKDTNGNIILAAGTALDWGRIGGINKPEDGATVGADWFNNVTNRPDPASFLETFESGNLAQWTNYGGSGELSVVSASDSLTGGKVLRIGNNSGNDQAWLGHKQNIPFNPSALYRIKFRVRRTAGTGTVYLGLAGVAADGMTWVNTSGANSTSSQHYVAAANQNPGASWTEYVGYVKGTAAAGQTGTNPLVTAPLKLHQNVRYIRPLIVANYMSAAGTVEVDYCSVELMTDAMSWDVISGAGKPEDGATIGAPAGTLVAGVQAANVAAAVTDFNASNNRNGSAITDPTILTNGTAVDHVAQKDGSVDISFEWGWSGNEGDIDGFLVYARPSTSSSAYTLGTTPAEETVYTVPANKRAFVLFGVAADKYYTFGVQAYRAVDKAINAAGVIKSTLVKAAGSGENPYRPSSTVAFTGDVTGTISGTNASTVVSNASTALTNANAAQAAAAEALGTLADIASDSKLTPAEKKITKKEWDRIVAEKSGINSQASALSITDENNAYINAYNALNTYITPLLSSLTTPSNIVGSTFRSTFSTFYSARQALLNKTAAVAATKADWSAILGAGKPESGATVGAPNGTLVGGVPAANVATAVTDFNSSNNRNNTAITSPTILTNGTAVDHIEQKDGSADISFEWGWAGSEGDIDGFLVFARQSTSATAYSFGTTPAEETVYTLPTNKRAFILFGVAADQYYTFGVQAYRAVDKAINSSGVIKSTLVKATGSGENPYRPRSSVAFSGDVIGTVNGTAAATLVSTASNALSAAGAAQQDATEALEDLADIAADNKLTPAEKKAVRKEWDQILAERASILIQADSFGITTEKTNYINDFNTLATYLNNLTTYSLSTTSPYTPPTTPPNWITDANLSVTTTITGTIFRNYWKNMYADRQALLNKIAAEAAKRADWNLTAGKPDDEEILNAGHPLNKNPDLQGAVNGAETAPSWSRVFSSPAPAFAGIRIEAAGSSYGPPWDREAPMFYATIADTANAVNEQAYWVTETFRIDMSKPHCLSGWARKMWIPGTPKVYFRVRCYDKDSVSLGVISHYSAYTGLTTTWTQMVKKIEPADWPVGTYKVRIEWYGAYQQYGSSVATRMMLNEGRVPTKNLAPSVVDIDAHLTRNGSPVYSSDFLSSWNKVDEAKMANFFASQSISNNYIKDVAVEKLIAGAIGVGTWISSTNYAAGSAGWRINADGSAEFRNITARGNIEASSLKAGVAMVDALSIKDGALIIPIYIHAGAATWDEPSALDTWQYRWMWQTSITLGTSGTVRIDFGNTFTMSIYYGHDNFGSGTIKKKLQIFLDGNLVETVAQSEASSLSKTIGVRWYNLSAGTHLIQVRGASLVGDGASRFSRGAGATEIQSYEYATSVV